jgi:proteasome maturation protein
MNIVPQDTFKSQVSTDQDKSVLSSAVPSLPDTLRQQEGGAVPLSTQLNDRHPLESTLKNWETTQRQRQMEQYRQIFGIAEPMKREIVNRTDFNPLSTNGSIHRDILLNKECSIDWEDVYPGTGLQASTMVGDDVHSKIEKQLGI